MGAGSGNRDRTASDLELVSLAPKETSGRLRRSLRRYSPRVFRVASKFFRQPAAVEDAAQEAFLKAYTQLSSYEGRGSLEHGWLELRQINASTCSEARNATPSLLSLS